MFDAQLAKQICGPYILNPQGEENTKAAIPEAGGRDRYIPQFRNLQYFARWMTQNVEAVYTNVLTLSQGCPE